MRGYWTARQWQALLAAALILVFHGGLADEPVIGGPCEGCELVFHGIPKKLASQAMIAQPDEPGEPMVIEGMVHTRDGQPVMGIIVYAYQTDAEGVYPRADTRHGRLRAWAVTDENGAYRFETIRPASYPASNVPQHVHMHVIEPGVGTYYIDDIVFSDDPLLTPRYLDQMRRGRGGDGVVDPVSNPDGSWHVRRDITLGLNIPGYE